MKLPYSKLRFINNPQKITIIAVIAAFSIIGSLLLVFSHAATSNLSVEPETGTPSGSAVIVSDATASGGKYVRFGSTPSGGDTTSPTVNITAPSDGATVSGTVAITATAGDNVGVTKVEFYVNGTLKTSDTSSPYSYSWAAGTTAGTYTLMAKAYDAAGNGPATDSVSVSVGGSTGGTTASATNPCVGNPAPAKWNHIVVLMFENKTYSNVIGTSSAPYITGLTKKCGTYTNWYDANYKVTGSSDGSYASKPNYATLTSGVPPSVHKLTNDQFSTTTGVDNIYNVLNKAGKSVKDYYSGSASSTPCASGNFPGSYHDAIRYYTNLGGQSSSTSTFCNTHDKPLSTFMTDVNAGNLPNFSMILPTNDENMHNNSISSGDTWAKNFLDPLMNSAQYKSGDTAIFFLWDEDKPIPNVLIAPSINPGSKPPTPSGNPISHFSATRTWQEMLGLSPTLGNSGQAPSLLNYYNGN